MTVFSILESRGLLSWSAVVVGLFKGWVSREDILEHAFRLLSAGDLREEVAVLAGGIYLNDDELLGLIKRLAKSEDEAESCSLDRWRLSFLLSIDNDDSSDEEKIRRLQLVYADFHYPEDMRSCSVYSADGVCPLAAMKKLIGSLTDKFKNKGGK